VGGGKRKGPSTPQVFRFHVMAVATNIEERKRKPMPTLFVSSFPPLTEKAQKKKKQVKLNKLREYSSSELK
jgi:hypothetical protein